MQLWNIAFIVPELHVCNSGTGLNFPRFTVLVRCGIILYVGQNKNILRYQHVARSCALDLYHDLCAVDGSVRCVCLAVGGDVTDGTYVIGCLAQGVCLTFTYDVY